MKTHYIENAFRNSTTRQAKLAAWQNRPAWYNLKQLREEQEKSWNKGKSLAELREERMRYLCPELSSPEAEAPLLWITDFKSPELHTAIAGRKVLKHCGWYTDDDQHSTMETYAVRLERFPTLWFYATLLSDSEDFCAHLDTWEEVDMDFVSDDYGAEQKHRDTAYNIIHGNDSTTERAAEESREFYERDQKEQQVAKLTSDLSTTRQAIRALCRELKTLCPTPLATTYPTAASALRSHLAGLLRDRRETMRGLTTLRKELA